jgi:hypothetical protein
MTTKAKYKKQDRERLLAQLAETGGDGERLHGIAEDLLLAYVDEPEITKAWQDALLRQDWYYA